MDRVEVITRVERRRKWSEAEKAAVLAQTDVPGTSVAAVARKHGIARSVWSTTGARLGGRRRWQPFPALGLSSSSRSGVVGGIREDRPA
jgi:transposase-like protein